MNTIKKETVEDIIRWAAEQGHINGDIELVIQTVYAENEEERQ